MNFDDTHCVKSVRIRSFSGPNAGKYGPENSRSDNLCKQNSSSIQDPIKLENDIAVIKLGSKICSSQ